jgi:hypothetical protein
MSRGEIIVLVCLLCLMPLWAAGSIILFALGVVRCGRMIDPYYDGGDSGGKRERCPLDPHGPRDDRSLKTPEDAGPGGDNADWWPRFERDLGRYVEEHESCPSAAAPTSAQASKEASGTRTPG